MSNISETFQKEWLALLWLFTVGFVARVALTALNPALGLGSWMIAPVASDMMAGFLIYRMARKMAQPEDAETAVKTDEFGFELSTSGASPYGLPFILTLSYLLNPAVLLNFYLVRMDGGGVFMMLASLVMLGMAFIEPESERPAFRRFLPFTFYGLTLIHEPAALVAAPVFIFAAVKYCNDNKFSGKSIFAVLGYGLVAAAVTFAFAVPFGLDNVFERFMALRPETPLSSVGAFNFYSLTAQNFNLDHPAGLTTFYHFVGLMSGAAIVFFAFYFLYKRTRAGAAMLCGAFLYTTAFVFDYHMHEWFMLPALVLLLAAYILEDRFRPELMRVYVGFSLTFFFNCMYVFMHGNEDFMDLPRYFVPMISFAQVVLAVYVLVIAVRLCKGGTA